MCHTWSVADKMILKSYKIAPDLVRGLIAASEAEYMPQSQVVRAALRAWLTDHGYLKKRGTRKQR